MFKIGDWVFAKEDTNFPGLSAELGLGTVVDCPDEYQQWGVDYSIVWVKFKNKETSCWLDPRDLIKVKFA